MARFAVERRSEALVTLIDNANSGKLRVYSGTRPATANTALSGNTLLAELTLGATSYTESGGVLTASAIASDSSADASGTASFVRIVESNGTTPVVDLGVTTSSPSSGNECQLNTLSIVAGAVVSCTAMTITWGVGA
ncbi:MAG TPA: hypothetical protein VL494_13820 [Steroidobacteraceae bacterium]|jgi:hypothetical protein|nr:hypothetical protein [Steroidobacteraceae bacterium]